MTVPNLLTLIRILLTPLLVWLLLGSRLTEALLVFFLAGITDGLDGFIARVFHQKSRLGAYLDPLADKILLVSSFILLGRLKLLPTSLVVIAVSRDALIVIGVMTLMFFQVRVEIRPSWVSKFTTLSQIVTVLATLATPLLTLPIWAKQSLYVGTGLLTITSGIHYILIAFRLWEGDTSGGNA